MTIAIAMLLRPFLALAVFGLVALPLRMVFERFYPDGRVKRFLLRPIGKKRRSGTC